MDISSVKRDSAKSEAGQWVSDIPEMGDLELQVRGHNSAAYMALYSRLMRAVPKEDRERDNSVKTTVALRVMGEAMAKTTLLDWRNLSDDGKPVPYDKDLALKWLTEPDYSSFLDAVLWAAQVVEKGKSEVETDLRKNSPKPSAGN